MSKLSRPSPRIRLLPRPPLTFVEFGNLIRAIGQAMDELGVAHEVSSDYDVANEGDNVTLRDPTGLAVMSFDLQTFRS